MRNVCRIVLLLLALCLSGPAGGLAQEPAASPEPAPVEQRRRLPEVLSQETAVRLELRKLEQAAQPSEQAKTILAELPGVNERVAAEAGSARELLEGAVRLRQLEEIENEWLRYRGRLEAWRATLTDRAVAMQGELDRLDELAEPWEWAAQRAASLDAPETVRANIASVQETIRTTRSTVESRWADLLALDAKLGDSWTIVVGVTDLADEQRQSRQGELLGAGRLPIWRVFAADRPASLIILVRDNFARLWRPIPGWAQDAPGALIFQALLLSGVLALAIALRPVAQAWAAEDESVRPTAQMLARPLAVATILAMSTTPFIHSTAPQGFRYLGGLLIVLALLRVIPILLRSAPLTALYLTIGVYLAERLRDLLIGDPVAERLLGVSEMTVLIGTFAWLLKPARREQLPGGPRARLLASGGLLLAAGIAAMALLTAVAGFSDLAEMLGEGVLRSGLAGVVLFAGYRVLRGLTGVALRSVALKRLNLVRRYHTEITNRLRAIWRFAALATWIYVTLDAFDLESLAQGTILAWLTREYHLGQLTLSVGALLLVALALGAAILLSRLTRAVLEEDVLPRMRLPRGVPQTISVTSGYAVLLLGTMLALTAGGFDMSSFALIAGALGVGIGFGLQNVVNNFVSGLILIFERPIQVGDTIELDQLIGEVRRIGVRASVVRTFQGAEVIVPNGDLISQRVTNWTLSDKRRRIELPIGVAYGSDPKQVIELLVAVARADEDVLDNPEPAALFRGFGDSSLDFELRAWTGAFDSWLAVSSNLNVAVHDALGEAGISIPFPQRDVHLIGPPPEAPSAP